MKKDKSIIETFISLINKQKKNINEELNATKNVTIDLALINKTFKEEITEDFSVLSNLRPSEFESLMSILISEHESTLKKNIEAACFLMNNGIDLVNEQKEKLKELNYRATIKRRNLRQTLEKRESNFISLKTCDELIDKLTVIDNGGYLENDTINKMFELLNIKEEEQSNYLDSILEFNLERINKLHNNINDEIEELGIEEVIDITSSITKQDLSDMFKKYGYDISIMNEELITSLINEGKLSEMKKILNSLNNNHIDFMKEKNTRNAKLLTKFLLESSGELIDEVCKTFSDARIDKDFLRSYKVVFFKSPEEKGENIDNKPIIKRKSKLSDAPVVTSSSQIDVVGKHKDFYDNLELLESFGYDRKELIENQVKLLTMSNSLLQRHVKELQLYEFPIGHERFPLSTMSSSDIMDLTDGFIELGEEEYIYKYSSRLTAYSSGTLERLYALKHEGLPYNNKTGRLLLCVTKPELSCGISDSEIERIVPKECQTILKGNKYSELLDKYVPLTISLDTLNEPMIKDLDEKYMISSKCYNMNGVLISRKKFLRNYEFLKTTDLISKEDKDIEQVLWVSALHNSMLNIEQIEKVNNALTGAIVVGGNNGLSKK